MPQSQLKNMAYSEGLIIPHGAFFGAIRFTRAGTTPFHKGAPFG